ncbi:TetR/AcrR family transcriptional regulator [Dyadobacter tibetensis]|uniref:TetR/AcrR family transcriptional regulator n=1 Tax=Dyadobacter tibetensis TaxID=1211851 RepID=UPI00047133BC|nr:TetR/AcrR family transcriptional regulator [Dyadobacter tibetensis]
MEYGPKQLQIISVAEALFAKKGFEGASIRDIAQEAKINISMISYYFGSKEKLIEALFDVRMVETQSTLMSILQNSELNALQKVSIWIDGIVERLMRSQNFHSIMMREQLSAQRSLAISEHIMNLKMKNIELMRQMLDMGYREGIFKEEHDLSLILTTVYGTVNQAIANKAFYKKINQLDHLTEEEYIEMMIMKLKVHLKNIFINTVSNETSND